MKRERTFFEKIIIGVYYTIFTVGFCLFAIEFPDLLNMLFDTDKFGTLTTVIAFVAGAYIYFKTKEILERERKDEEFYKNMNK